MHQTFGVRLVRVEKRETPLLTRAAIWIVGITLALSATAPDACAYIHYPPMTLQKMCKDSHHIRVLTVEKFDKEKGVIVFENTESLKTKKVQITSFKYVIRPGADGTKPLLDWIENKKTAVMFSIEGMSENDFGGIGYVFIDNYCYTFDYNKGGKYWFLIRAEPGMSDCYHGTTEQLRSLIKDILDGKEVKVPVKSPVAKDEWDKRYKEVNDVLKINRDLGKDKKK